MMADGLPGQRTPAEFAAAPFGRSPSYRGGGGSGRPKASARGPFVRPGRGFLQANSPRTATAPYWRQTLRWALAMEPWLIEVSARRVSEIRKSPQLGEPLRIPF